MIDGRKLTRIARAWVALVKEKAMLDQKYPNVPKSRRAFVGGLTPPLRTKGDVVSFCQVMIYRVESSGARTWRR